MKGPPTPNGNTFSYPIGQARHRIQSYLYDGLKRVPNIENVRWEEADGEIGFIIVGDVDTSAFADGIISSDEAGVIVDWWPQPDGEEDWFKFHYTDGTGYDCGWHRQPNNHVDGLSHFQERDNPSSSYNYEEVEFGSSSPSPLVWEVLDYRLHKRLADHYRERG